MPHDLQTLAYQNNKSITPKTQPATPTFLYALPIVVCSLICALIDTFGGLLRTTVNELSNEG